MMAPARSALRVVVLPSPTIVAQESPTRRLLDELGHDVSRASTPDHALELIHSDHTDLLVVDITGDSNNRDVFDSLHSIPESQRPDEVAIFTDSIDDSVQQLRCAISPSHVHVYLKPLHMHGLLNVLRHLERKSTARANV